MTVVRRHPEWIKVKAPHGETFFATRRIVQDLRLHTVCEEAHCPNVGECWGHRTATFMLLGEVCTRNCSFCAVATDGRNPWIPWSRPGWPKASSGSGCGTSS